ncbi:MAG: hypothetical protein ACTSWD_09525 [Candidatus Heimdallarchaeota archaeon]
MEQYIRHQLKRLKPLTTEKRVYGLNAIYAVLEAQGHTPQQIKRAIDKVISQNIKKLSDSF